MFAMCCFYCWCCAPVCEPLTLDVVCMTSDCFFIEEHIRVPSGLFNIYGILNVLDDWKVHRNAFLIYCELMFTQKIKKKTGMVNKREKLNEMMRMLQNICLDKKNC